MASKSVWGSVEPRRRAFVDSIIGLVPVEILEYWTCPAKKPWQIKARVLGEAVHPLPLDTAAYQKGEAYWFDARCVVPYRSVRFSKLGGSRIVPYSWKDVLEV